VELRTSERPFSGVPHFPLFLITNVQNMFEFDTKFYCAQNKDMILLQHSSTWRHLCLQDLTVALVCKDKSLLKTTAFQLVTPRQLSEFTPVSAENFCLSLVGGRGKNMFLRITRKFHPECAMLHPTMQYCLMSFGEDFISCNSWLWVLLPFQQAGRDKVLILVREYSDVIQQFGPRLHSRCNPP
jgi:hypothetical protein